MRKLSIALTAAAGLALVAGVAAAPALADLRITIGPPTYYQPNYGTYYGYNTRPYYSPSYRTYPNRRYNTYPNYAPNYAPYSRRYDRNYYYPGYFGR
jgi:hypothetical protein